MDQINDKITADHSKGTYPFQGGIFSESVITTFRNISDEMPPKRKKYIHSVGWVAEFEFTPVQDHEFTGVFSGVSKGFIRPSLAKPYADDNITPGFGIKFLRDSVPSCNFVAMPSLNGQTDKNYFKNTFTNHPTPPHNNLPLQLVAVKFEQASSCPAMVGLSHCAKHDSQGNVVDDPKFPFEILFEPTSMVQRGFEGADGAAFYDDWFRNLAVDTKMFNVMQQATPEDRVNNNKKKMGEIRNKTAFNTSKYGDTKLFFRHDWVENDFVLRPEWQSYMKSNNLLEAWTGNAKCVMSIPNSNCN